MHTRPLTFAIFLSLTTILLAPSVRAASVAFVPLTPTSGVTQGDIVSLQILVDFSDVVDSAGNVVGTLGGSFSIYFDPDQLAYVGLDYNVVGDPAFARQPDILPGLLEAWGMASYDGIIGPVIAGSVDFEVLSSGPFSSNVYLWSGSLDPWVSAGDFITIIDTQYGMITVSGVPLPAAGWLLIGALAGLAGLRRN